MSRSLHWSLAILLASAVGCTGGGGSGNGGSLSTASTSSSTNTRGRGVGTTGSGSITGVTPTTRGGSTSPGSTAGGTGTATGTGSPTIQSNGPTITVTSPTRASFTTTAATTVEGTVTDPAGVAMVTLNGNPIAVGAGGKFSAPLTLVPGVNIISVEATNNQNTQNKETLSVLYGSQFQPVGTPVTDAMDIRLNKGSFDTVSTIAASLMTPAQLQAQVLAMNPVVSGSVPLIGIGYTVDVNTISFNQPQIVLAPQPGDLQVTVVIPNLSLNLTAKCSFISESFTISADSATLTASIAVNIAGGKITTSVVNDSVSFQNFNFQIQGFFGFLSGLASGLVQNMLTSQITNMVKTVLPTQINNMLAGAMAKPLQMNVMGVTTDISVVPLSIAFDGAGATLVVNSDISMTPVAGFTPPQAPGSLVTNGGMPNNVGPTPGFQASFNEDFLNRAAFAVWQSGLADITIDNTSASFFQLPSFIPLDMGLLQLFLPELVGKAPATDTIAIKISPQLPPVFLVHAAPGIIDTQLGDFEIQIWDTTPATPTLVLALSLQANVGATPAMAANGNLVLQVAPNPTIDASLAASPLAPTVNTIGIDNLVGFIGPALIQIGSQLWSGYPLPVYQGVSVANLTFNQDGAQGTFLTISGDLK